MCTRTTILELKDGLEQAGFSDQAYRESIFMRLTVLRRFQEDGWLTDNLEWLSVEKRSTPAQLPA